MPGWALHVWVTVGKKDGAIRARVGVTGRCRCVARRVRSHPCPGGRYLWLDGLNRLMKEPSAPGWALRPLMTRLGHRGGAIRARVGVTLTDRQFCWPLVSFYVVVDAGGRPPVCRQIGTCGIRSRWC